MTHSITPTRHASPALHYPHTPANDSPGAAERMLAILLVGLGAAAMALAIAADFVGGGATMTSVFGLKQTAVAAAGLAGVLWGIDLRSAEGLHALRDWRAALRRLTLANAAAAAFVVAEVLLMVLAIRQFRLESPAFFGVIAPLALFGFVIHHVLPMRRRIAFFAGLSMLGACAVFGVGGAAWLIGVGIGLIAICHLPVPYWWRVALLLATGGVLAAARADLVAAPWVPGVWPILGSMFMFRLIVYMYDLRHSKEPMGVARTLAYFFLLPNLTFPLFPVVDFATFKKTYYDRDAFSIYQEGVQWMIRGITHLLLYRFVYQILVITPEQITSVPDLGRYIGANFLLYLRVSGQFHLIVGLLHLFGFRLPETHRFFYLASGFTEFWRRINIYWKDFVMKVVYYPTYFRLRKWGFVKGNEAAGLILATIAVFAATWFLHAYQWFWILGKFLLSWTDVAFWSILAALLIGNTLLELKNGRARTLRAPKWTARMLAKRALQTAGTFVVISTLWALWTSETFASFAALWKNAGVTRDIVGSAAQIALLLLGVIAGALLFTLLFRARVTAVAGGATLHRTRFALGRSAALSVAPIALLFAVGEPAVTARFALGVQEAIYKMRFGELNGRDTRLLQQGYYENLVGANRFGTQLWEVYASRPSPKAWPWILHTKAARQTDDFVRAVLNPNVTILFHGAQFSTNRWGMRDKDYPLTPPSGTVRIALLGQSYVMGESVADGETFENVTEERLNGELALRTGKPYEIMNFGLPMQRPTIQLRWLEMQVLGFDPDVAIFVGHQEDLGHSAAHLAHQVIDGHEVPYDFMREITRKAGVTRGLNKVEAEALMQPYEEELLRLTYRRIVELCRERGVRPYYLYLTTPDGVGASETNLAKLTGIATEAGLTVINLADIYDGHDLQTVQVASWDRHPNARGHRLIADRLYTELARPGRLDPSAPPTAQPSIP
ncbi:MAG: hypothetical protein ACR2G6_07935 [Gemmatimonadaceae bacterium]